MANEFIARKGLIVLENGIKVTGSSEVHGNITASGNVAATYYYGSGKYLTELTASHVDFSNIDNLPTLVSSSEQFNNLNAPFTGSFTGSFVGDGSQLTGVVSTLSITGSTSGTDSLNLKTEGLIFSGANNVTATVTDNTVTIGVTGLISESVQVDVRQTTGIETLATTGSNTFVGNQIITGSVQTTAGITGSFSGDGSQLTNVAASVIDFANILNKPALVSASAQIDHNSTTNYVANEHIDHSTVSINAGLGLSGGGDITATRELALNTGSAHFTGGVKTKLNADGVVSSSAQVDVRQTTGIATLATTGSNTFVGDQIISGSLTTTADTMNFNGAMTISGSLIITGSVQNTNGGFTGSFSGDGSGLTGLVTALSITGSTSGTDSVDLKTEGLLFSASNNVTATVTNNTVTIGVVGLVSQSSQIDVRNTTGIATIATTGSNTFTGVQTITDTTNSTNYTDGALVVAGGVGIGKDVNISGSLTVLGILTAATMSTQYVTSSQLNIGTSRVIVNDDDLVRFAGLTVIDSGSTPGSGSLLWDSLYNRWIYQADDQAYNSAILIAGPKNTGSLGDEVGLTTGKVPVAIGDDHIGDSQISDNGLTVAIAGELLVTGSVTASAFAGDGSNLTGVVSTLSVTGSQGGQSSINLKTQGLTVTGTNGVAATISGQTLTISGSNATTTAKGVASFTGSNFTVTDGEVSTNPINFNGVNLDNGGTYAFGLQNITSTGATTSDVVTLTNGLVAATILYTSSLSTGVTGPVTNQVVASIPTGSYITAHFNYVINDGTNFRTGTVMSVWNGGNIQFTDTSTNDIGDTTGANFNVDTNSANVRLKFTVPTGVWTVKTSTQLF